MLLSQSGLMIVTQRRALLIAGQSSGIGRRRAALAFAKAGIDVCPGESVRKRLEAAMTSAAQQTGVKVKAYHLALAGAQVKR